MVADPRPASLREPERIRHWATKRTRLGNHTEVRYVAVTMRRFPLALIALAVSTASLVVPQERASAAAADAIDFDGDGRGDLVVPVVGEAIEGQANAGAVHVFYGSPSGVGTDRAQIWSQDAASIRDESEADDRFGAAWSAGDFNADGRTDLAVGAPGEDGNVGIVNVLYGSPLGLRAAGNQVWFQDKADMPGTGSALDGFGSALVAGDFDGDDDDDLAIGAPVDAANGTSGAGGGTVTIVYGGSTGLTAAGAQLIGQNSDGVLGDAEVGDLFGLALAAGDIDNDGRDDLGVGAPYEDYIGVDAGTVTLFFGSATGVQTSGSVTLLQGARGLTDSSQAGDTFGSAIEIGYFDHGPYADLVVGIPGQRVGLSQNAGALMTIPGGAAGLRISRNAILDMGSERVAGAVRAGTLFGDVLERADFDGNGRDDLVVGVWAFDRNFVPNTGAIITMYGGTTMFGGAIPSALITQDTDGIVDSAEPNDSFGWSVTSVDANGDGQDGLWVGVPLEDFGSVTDAGAGHVFGGGGFGLVAQSSTLWTQSSPGVPDSPQSGDLFGGDRFFD